MKKRTQAEAFNEWMRRYIETPEKFEREMTSVNAFLAASRVGREPDYGELCAEYLSRLMDERGVVRVVPGEML